MNDAIPALQWQALPFDALDVHQLYAVLKLRAEVFVVEQACAYLDPDGLDSHPDALHLLGQDGATLAACLRILPPGTAYRHPSIGRVALATSHRGRGLGHALMAQGLQATLARWPGSEIRLGAQAHLSGYYQAHGFQVASPIYDEDGIPHITMRRPADASG